MPDARDFRILNGDLAAAFDALACTPASSRLFTPVDVLMSQGQEIGEAVEIAKSPDTIPGIFVALYGADSNFRRQLPKAEGAVVTPVRPLEGAPWCGTGVVNFSWHVPIFGASDYQEELRVGLCHKTGAVCLAVQAALTVAVGFPIGDLLLEVLYTFTQASAEEPIVFQAKGIVPRSAFFSMLWDSLVQARNDYVDAARRLILRSGLCGLQLELPSCEARGEEDGSEESAAGYKAYGGGLMAALAAQPHTPEGDRPFAHPDVVMRGGSALLSGVQVARPPATVLGVFLALYGAGSRFRLRVPGAERGQIVRPVEPLPDAPWCGVGVVKLLAPVPLAGDKEYVEEVRTALRSSGARMEVAVQAACTFRMGFPFGDVRMESLYIFSQASPDEPVLFSAYGSAQAGRAQEPLMQCLQKGAEVFVETAQAFLGTGPPERFARGPPEVVDPPEGLEPVPDPGPAAEAEQGVQPVTAHKEEEEEHLQWMWSDSALLPLPGMSRLSMLNPMRWSALRPPLALAAELSLQSGGRGVILRTSRGSTESFPDVHAAASWIQDNMGPGSVRGAHYSLALMSLCQTTLTLKR